MVWGEWLLQTAPVCGEERAHLYKKGCVEKKRRAGCRGLRAERI